MSARSSFAWRRAVPASVVALVAGSVAAAAVTSGGFHARHVSLDDGGIWTAQADSVDPSNPGSFVGRANIAAAVIDTAVVAPQRPQLLQDGAHVIFHDAASGTVTSIDTVLGTSGSALTVPPLVAPAGTLAAGTVSTPDNQGMPTVNLNAAGEVGLGADAVGAVDQGTGKVYVFAADALPSGPLAAQKPVATEPRGSRLAVGVDGVTHVVTPAGAVDDFGPTGGKLRHSSLGADLTKVTTPGSPFTVTAVGARAVVLDGNGGLYAEGHSGSIGSVGDAGSAVLQEPGAERPGVLVEAGADLVAASLSTGNVKVLSDAGAGAGTAPVFVPERGCAYGAWASRAAVPADASTTGSPARQATAVAVCDDGRHFTGAGEENPVWRVNRGSALLNDEVTGKNLFFDGLTPLAIDDWSQAQRPSKGQQSSATSGTTLTEAQTPETPSGADQSPVANDDNLATRPGVPLIAHVLANDTDPDGDVLAVTGLSDLPAGDAKVSIVDGGSHVQVTPGDSSAPVTFTYTVDDGRGATSSAHVTVAIHPADVDAPPALPPNEPAVDVDAGAHITVDLLRDAVDPDGDALTLTSARLPAGAGSVETTPSGLAVVTPSVAGSTVLAFTVSDGHGGTTQGTQTFTVSPPGAAVAPQTHDDHLDVSVGAPGTVDVLVNDTDGSGSPLTLASVSSPPGLSVSQLGGGLLGVTASSAGTSLVHYTAGDGATTSTGTLRVDALPAGQGQRVVAVRDDAAVRPAIATVVPVLVNDVDTAGAVLVIDGLGALPPGLTVTQQDHASLTIETDQPLTTTESFTYDVSDGTAASTGTVVVRPAPGGVDQPPVTAPYSVNVRAGNGIPLDVLAHDFDPEGESLTLVSVSPPPSGEGTAFVESGQLRYLAPDVPVGAATLTYVVRDSQGNSSTGTVTVHVLAGDATNHPPQPPDVTARVYENRAVTVDLPLLGIDPDGDVTTLVAVAPPTLGAPVLGSIESPLGAQGFTFDAGPTGGTQELTYQVRDAAGLLATGDVHIGVVAPPAENSPPVAEPDTVAVAAGALRRVAVLRNDSDPDGDTITLDPAQLTRPSGGRVTVDGAFLDVTAPAGVPDGTVVSFDYGIGDGRGGTGSSTVTETVTAHPPPVPPVAVDDTEAPQRAGATVTAEVLANDTIVDGTPAQATVAAVGLPGVTALPGGSLRFVMPGHPVTFAYTVTVVSGASASALVTVPLAGGQPPAASPDTASTTAGVPVALAVTANDRDPQGLPLRVTKVSGLSGGRAVVTDATHVTFTPAAGFTGLGGFSYVVSDGALTATGSAVVRVTGGPDHPPSASALTLRVAAGTSSSVDLSAAASDPDVGDKLAFGGLRGGGAGLSASLSGARLKVSAALSARGQVASFNYTVSDGHPRGTVTGSVQITVVSSTKPLPRALPDSATALGVAVTVPVLANDVDPLGTGLRLLGVSSAGSDGTTTIGARDVVFTPAHGFHGVVTLTYQIADASNDPSRHATGTIRITVVGVPDAPGLPTGSATSRTVMLTWAVPSANGGTISGYVVSWGGGTKACPTNSCTVTGLDNGHSYTFSVVATDQAGRSPASPSATLKVDQAPDAPQAPTATPGDQKISLTWPVPHVDGSAPTSYDVVVSPGGMRQQVTTTSATFGGLTNGTAYTFTVDATNDAGTSPPSAASAPATPAGLAGTPAAPKASTTADAQTAVATWSAPSDNGSPITSYTLEVFENGSLRQTIAEKDTSNRTDTVAATNGDTYSFAVSATNAVGTSPYSPRSNEVKATGRPAQVGTVTATSGKDSQVPLAWSAPADNGSAVTSYQVAASGGRTYTFTTAGGTADQLANGTSYTFTVSACNTNGCGPASGASNAATPFTTPNAPSLSGSASGNDITWTWRSGGDGGSAITKYAYKRDSQDFVGTTDTSYTGHFACGESHSLYLHADNAAGSGPDSSTVTVKTGDCPPTFYPETEKDYSGNTFHDYHNASDQGPDVKANETVQVDCKVYDPTIKSVNPDGYWYRLHSAPWNGYYYEAANAFVNGGQHTDRSVPDC